MLKFIKFIEDKTKFKVAAVDNGPSQDDLIFIYTLYQKGCTGIFLV